MTPVPRAARPSGIRLGQPDPAERAVAGLVADGLTNPEIGERLYISRRTVQTHLVHVLAKLGSASRAQLAAQVTHHCRQEPPPAQVAPAEDSALTGEPPRGAYLPRRVLSPAAGRRKQRFTAQPRSGCADDGIRRMADVPCRPRRQGKDDGAAGRRRLIVMEE